MVLENGSLDLKASRGQYYASRSVWLVLDLEGHVLGLETQVLDLNFGSVLKHIAVII